MHLSFLHIFSWITSLFVFSTEIILYCLGIPQLINPFIPLKDILVAFKSFVLGPFWEWGGGWEEERQATC